MSNQLPLFILANGHEIELTENQAMVVAVLRRLGDEDADTSTNGLATETGRSMASMARTLGELKKAGVVLRNDDGMWLLDEEEPEEELTGMDLAEELDETMAEGSSAAEAFEAEEPEADGMPRGGWGRRVGKAHTIQPRDIPGAPVESWTIQNPGTGTVAPATFAVVMPSLTGHTCPKCGEAKPLEAFGVRKCLAVSRRKAGTEVQLVATHVVARRQSFCRKCRKAKKATA